MLVPRVAGDVEISDTTQCGKIASRVAQVQVMKPWRLQIYISSYRVRMTIKYRVCTFVYESAFERVC